MFKGKKFALLIASLAVIWSMSLLTGCKDKAAEEQAARQAEQDKITEQFLRQGSGKVRKAGTRGMANY